MTNEAPKEAARRLAAGAISQGFKPEALHEYRAADKSIIYWRIRAKRDDGEKWIRPMRLNGHGYELKEPEFPAGKPLFNLDLIAANLDVPIVVCEGEKDCNALTSLGVAATTSGGAQSATSADWTPLHGRDVWLWPDNDDTGRSYVGEVAAILYEMECKLSCIDIDSLALPPKGGAADWVETRQNATAGDIAELPRHVYQGPAKSGSEDVLTQRSWPDALAGEAFHGLAGEIVRAIEPQTEGDPAAVLVQFLVAVGNYIGRGAHYRVEGDEHHVNLFVLLVGETAKARKGTSWGRVRELIETCGSRPPVAKGLTSGEGLKYAVRDPIVKAEYDKNANCTVEKEIDPGVSDKRLLVVEEEFAQALRAASRPGNTLSATIREAWDGRRLATLTKNDAITATEPHISIIGHITSDELRAELTATDSANGFANRFLMVAARRSKLLPHGGEPMPSALLGDFARRIECAASIARTRYAIPMTPEARETWAAVYPVLSDSRAGLHGAVTARAEAQCIRLALIYALLDKADAIHSSHLGAALAVWDYCDATARYVFGSALGDRVADTILEALQTAGANGLTRTDISRLFQRHESADRIEQGLALLRRRNMAAPTEKRTGGAPAKVWIATAYAKKAKSAK